MHPVQTVAHLMKLSFDEGHRYAICQLGGINIIATLIEVCKMLTYQLIVVIHFYCVFFLIFRWSTKSMEVLITNFTVFCCADMPV